MPATQATLLIVDDEPSVRLTLSNVLAEVGYSVRSAGDGLCALHEIQNEVPKLLLSDLNMPNMSGFELLSVVRRRFPAIWTIAMSGSFSGNEAHSGVAADGFYQKGSSIAALLRIMETLPQTERKAQPPTSPDELLWIHHKSLGTGYLKRKADCIYCHCSIHYAIVQDADRMPLQAYQRQKAEAMRFPQSAHNLSY
jgi:CheY-like chemotaxis protein